MAITRFPLETDEPVVDVNLPPGRHVLELVVEDSAGLRSEPDTVTITIENVLPVITAISPETARQDAESLSVVITGDYLENVQGVSFLGAGITVESFEETSSEALAVVLSVAPDAAPGPSLFTVTTDQGEVQSPAGVTFTVEQGLPVITAIEPDSGRQGASDLTLTIRGRYLEDVEEVTFLDDGIDIDEMRERSPEALEVVVSIEPEATPGARRFQVTTDEGSVVSPAGVTFTVEQQLPLITAIEPESGLQGARNLNVIISGENLVDVQRVIFGGVGIDVRDFSERSPTELSVFLDIAEDATAGARSFVVTTSGGEAKSPIGVSFTVQTAAPAITGIDPDRGNQGSLSLTVAIEGFNLVGVQGVSFEGTGITVRSFEEVRPNILEVILAIDLRASTGARSFTVQTEGGEAKSPPDVVFTVTGVVPTF